MRNKIKHYVSYRVMSIFIFMEVFILLLLFGFTIMAIRERGYMLPVISFYIVFGILTYGSYKWIYQTYKKNAKVLQLFANGYTLQGVFEQRISLSPEIEQAIQKFKEIINTKELINASKKQAEYLALQNQINPHFLYNTLEGIRGETLQAGLESVAEMTEALATFFRYTISNVEQLVTLEDELSNIENYYIIQQYRFGERLNLGIYFEEEDEKRLLNYKLPKLTLQPIIENAIYHGVERKIGNGHISIKIESTSSRLIITISDDGLGMEEERLVELNHKLNNMSFDYIESDNEKKGGIAMVNVNRRIKLIFGEEYGICVYSTLNAGTDVDITLPLIEKI